MKPKHYQATCNPITRTWGYTTPTGEVDQIQSERLAWKLAKSNEYQDRETAAHGGPFAAILREYFEQEEAAV